jgi:hypothetical protein
MLKNEQVIARIIVIYFYNKNLYSRLFVAIVGNYL